MPAGRPSKGRRPPFDTSYACFGGISLLLGLAAIGFYRFRGMETDTNEERTPAKETT
jgi:hypothetical protein